MKPWYLFALIAGTARVAAGDPMTPGQIKDAVRIESLTIPTPGEFFVAITKQSQPDWKAVTRSVAPTSSDSRAQIALELGTFVAEGYIAVEAQDSQGVKNIGREIISLAKKLNVSQSVLGRGNSISDFAQANDWTALREELDATQNEVKLDMVEQKDSSLVTLVTVGAWIRGTEIASGLIAKGYTPETARLLRQPAIIEYLLSQVAALPPALREDPIVAFLEGTLKKSLPLVEQPIPSEQAVKDFHDLMAVSTVSILKGLPQ